MKNDDCELIKELRCLRMRLSPIISDHYQKVLSDVEKRLSGGSYIPPANLSPLKKKNLTKKELKEYFNSRGL